MRFCQDAVSSLRSVLAQRAQKLPLRTHTFAFFCSGLANLGTDYAVPSKVLSYPRRKDAEVVTQLPGR